MNGLHLSALAFGIALAIGGAGTDAAAAEIFRLERQYEAPPTTFDRMVGKEFYWLERVQQPGEAVRYRLAGKDALTGADIIPQFTSVPGPRRMESVFSSHIVIEVGDNLGGRLSVYDRNTGVSLGSRRLTDPAIAGLVKDNTLTLVQNGRGGVSYLSRFTLPGMTFDGETHPAFLAGIHSGRFFDDRIVGWSTQPCAANAYCPIDLVTASLDGQEISRVKLPGANSRNCGNGILQIEHIDGPRIAVRMCRFFVVDLQQQRVVQSFDPFPDAGSWFTFSRTLVFMRPERGSVDVVRATARDIRIFDLETGRELGQADLAPGPIRVVGDKLLLRPYAATSEIFVYAIDESALSR